MSIILPYAPIQRKLTGGQIMVVGWGLKVIMLSTTQPKLILPSTTGSTISIGQLGWRCWSMAFKQLIHHLSTLTDSSKLARGI